LAYSPWVKKASECATRIKRSQYGREIKNRTYKRRGGDSNPRRRDYRRNGFRDRRIQPLCHLSAREFTAYPYPLQPPLHGSRNLHERASLKRSQYNILFT
jgi:hypothetical protein